tara:strand:+ start:518 stop:2407 length:1890 start_codon:yes stop_codon:yes gene_type:complete
MALFAPLAGFLFVTALGCRLGDRFSAWFTTACLGFSCCIFWGCLVDFAGGADPIYIHFLDWLTFPKLKVAWGLYIDTLTAVMLVVVTTVSFLVHLYSIEYMSHDESLSRFMGYLSLFTFMMLMLVTSSNLIQLFFGWEGVGLASYLLIGFWHYKDSANAAAMKAFIVNRVGDLGLVLGIATVYFLFGTVDIQPLLAMLSEQASQTFSFLGMRFPALEVAAFLFFIGAMGKSAQLGLHTWLPDAMEGPTPVSALIHAATMVTAGVFLVARLSPLYEMAPYARSFITIVGASTALFAGTIALTQNDIKRVIAYSTCSQLGYMFFAAGLSYYNIAIFHLFTHAFFKALLFLGAGAVIHALSDEQDMRKMGGIWKAVPVTASMMWIGSFALAGIPFFAGYYSKDAILAAAWTGEGASATYACVVGLVAAFLTAFYSWRLLYMTFSGVPRADEKVMSHLHEPGYLMQIPLIILSGGALFSGMLGLYFVASPDFWSNALVLSAGLPHIEGFFHYLPLMIALVGVGLATLFYQVLPEIPKKLSETFQAVYCFLSRKWYFDELYEFLFIKTSLKLGSFLWTQSDQRVIDRYGPDGVSQWCLSSAKRTSQAQTGYLYHYALVFVLGLVAAGLWFLFLS